MSLEGTYFFGGNGEDEEGKNEDGAGCEYSGPDSTESYDCDQWERLQEDRSKQEFLLLKRLREGDESAGFELKMHEEEDDNLRDLAWQSGYYWA